MLKQILLNFRTILSQSLIDFKYNYHHIKIQFKDSREKDYAKLRTYCHMLDKGMNNINFEKGHSSKYITIAKNLRNKLYPYYSEDRCFKWVDDIICKFELSQRDGSSKQDNRAPYQYNGNQVEEITNFITNRTSCRNFVKKTIPSDVIRKIVSLAIDAPNSCCRQVVRYYITQNEKIISNATSHIAGITNFSNIQCLVCIAAEVSFYNIQDKNLQYVDASLSAENFILSASLYGIYGTMCNFFHASEDDIVVCKKLFEVKDTENIVMFLGMGYPINIPRKPLRMSVDSFYKEI